MASPPSNPLERVMSLAHCYIGPLLSDQVKQKQEKKLKKIKQEILHARDILKSHSSLIEKLKEEIRLNKGLPIQLLKPSKPIMPSSIRTSPL